MNNLKLRWRGPLLIAFPLLCQGIFIFAVIFMLADAQKSLIRGESLRDGLLRLNQVTTDFIEHLIYRDDVLKTANQIPTQLSSLTSLGNMVTNLPPERATSFKKSVDDLTSILYRSSNALSIKQVDKANVRREVFLQAFRMVPRFLSEMKSVVEINNNIRKEEFSKSIRIKDNILHFINIAIVASLLVAAAMFVVFTVSIKRPIQHIAENSRRLSKKTPLLPPLSGNNELSRLDQSIHQTYDAVLSVSERELALINNVSDLVCSLNPEGIFLEANTAAIQMLGLPADQLTGKSIGDMAVPAESLLAEEYVRKACQPGDVSNFEIKMQTVGGAEVQTLWSVVWSPFRRRLFCVVRDVTAEKALARMKQDFIDMVSHDLRSPLTSLGITLEMMESGKMGTVNADALKELKATNKNVQILINFINDLLDFQKLDEGRVHLDKTYCSSNEIIKEAISSLKDVAGSKQINIDYAPKDFEIFCDQMKVTQTVLNLLSNAIKFSPHESVVKIILSEEETADEASYIRVTVKDSGPGIPDELKEKIFEPFEQAPSHKTQGTGLGLAICKMIVTGHGGSIGVTDSESSSGSAFWFTIPTSEETPAQAPQASSSPTDQNLFLD